MSSPASNANSFSWSCCAWTSVSQHTPGENGHLWLIYPSKMVIFHSYVSLPEGTSILRQKKMCSLLLLPLKDSWIFLWTSELLPWKRRFLHGTKKDRDYTTWGLARKELFILGNGMLAIPVTSPFYMLVSRDHFGELLEIPRVYWLWPTSWAVPVIPVRTPRRIPGSPLPVVIRQANSPHCFPWPVDIPNSIQEPKHSSYAWHEATRFCGPSTKRPIKREIEQWN